MQYTAWLEFGPRTSPSAPGNHLSAPPPGGRQAATKEPARRGRQHVYQAAACARAMGPPTEIGWAGAA